MLSRGISKNLPDYAQYEDLISYIRSSDHSIVVLTGDVHFGRIAYGELRVGSGAKLVEAISSPMQAVPDGNDNPLFGSYREAPTHHFPKLESMEVACRRNQFATVEFRSGDGGRVNMKVRSWPIPRPEDGALQGSRVEFETTLL